MNFKKTNSRIAAVKLCYQKQRIGNSQLGETILIQKKNAIAMLASNIKNTLVDF